MFSKLAFSRGVIAVIATLAFGASAPIVFAGAVTTWNVNNDAAANCSDLSGAPFCTIGAAVATSTAGDTISVAAGDYTENLTINKSITLNGPNVGVAGNGTRVPEARILNSTISFSGSNTIVMDGFHIYTTKNDSDVVMISANTAVTFTNSKIERVGVTTGNIVRAITTAIGSTANVQIANNLFTGDISGGLYSGHKTWYSAIYSNGGTNINITGNVFENSRTALNLDNFSVGVTVSGNTFKNSGTYISFGGTTPTDGQYTISGNNFETAIDAIFNLGNVADTFRINVTGNTFLGKATGDLSLAESFAIEAGMYHRGRSGHNGLVTYVAGKQFVIAANPSIQRAINKANSGDTINVATGTYKEQLNIDKQVILNGAGSDTSGTILTNPTSSADLSRGLIQLTGSGASSASPLTIENLRVQPVGMAGISVGHFTGSDGVLVNYVSLNNVKVVGTGTNICSEQERGLYVDNTSSLNHLTITNSSFDNLTYGWYFNKAVSTDTSTVSDVSVSNTTFSNNKLKGIYVEKLSNASFVNTTVANSGTATPADVSTCSGLSGSQKTAAGFNVNLKAGTYQNLSFDHMTIAGAGVNADQGAGLMIEARGTGSDSSYTSFPASLSGVAITNSTFTGNKTAIQFGEPGKNNAGPTNVTMSKNSITGSTSFGIDNETLSSVNAANNWWGNATGPKFVSNANGTGDKLSTSTIAYTPWYIDSGRSAINTDMVGTHITIPAGGNFAPTGTTSGAVSLPSGTSDLNLGNNSVLDFSTGTSTVISGNVSIGGSSVSLNGEIVLGVDLNSAQTIGSTTVMIAQAVKLSSGTSTPIVIMNTALPNVSASIPDGTTILAPSGWTGTIAPPTEVSNPSGTTPSGFSIGSTVISVGDPLVTLLFNKPVTLMLTGVTGTVGYKPAGSSAWTEITNTCGTDYNNPTNPTFPNECSISNGTDTKILTYHFTTFGGLAPVAPVISPNGGVFHGSTDVTITNSSNWPMHYTTDGSTPNCSSASYGSTFSVSGSTVKAVSCDGQNPSAVTTALFSSAAGGGSSGGSSGGSIVTPAAPATPAASVTPATPAAPAASAKGEVLGAAVYNFAKNLTVGSKSADVTALQQFLADNKFYTGPVTGSFGALTKKAVVAFQKAHKIAQTGSVGPLTRVELNKGVIAVVPEAVKISSTSKLTAAQTTSILGLLQSFNADASVIAQVKLALGQ